MEIENTISRTTLHKDIWIPHKFRALDLESHDLTKNVFKIWDAVYQKKDWVYNSPLMALTGTIFFLYQEKRYFLDWKQEIHNSKISLQRGR